MRNFFIGLVIPPSSHGASLQSGLVVIDSNGTSASTGIPTLVDDGTPVGHPTPAGEPTNSADMGDEHSNPDQAELFKGLHRTAGGGAVSEGLLAGIGGLILAWGQLEQTTAEKLAVMRQSFGDVRAVGGRSRPTMQKLLAELRALVAMRDRHDKQALTLIAEIDGALQRTAQFRLLIVEGAQSVSGDLLSCRDAKNSLVTVSAEEIARERARLERIRCQISEL